MLGVKHNIGEISSSDTKNNPGEANKRAKKNLPYSSIEDRLYEAINEGNERLINELTSSVDFHIETIDTRWNEQPILITLIEHGYTSAALRIIDKIVLFTDRDIINRAMYTAIKKCNDVLIDVLLTHDLFNPNLYLKEGFFCKKQLLCELIDHGTSNIALRIMRERYIFPGTRCMALEEAIRKNIPDIIEGMLQIFSIEKQEIFIHAYTLIELFEKKYISEHFFNNEVLNKSVFPFNHLDYISVINFLIKSKKTMKLNENLFLNISNCLERNLGQVKAYYKDEIFGKIHLKTSISESDKDCLNKILPISFPIYLKTLFKHYLKETKIERSLPLYAEAYAAYVSDFYKNNRIFFHNHLFMEENILELREDAFRCKIKKVIYNNDGFDISENNNSVYKKGSPLKTDGNIPIGYTVYLPTGGTYNSIVVNVYGGGDAFSLGTPLPIDIALLDKKIVQVDLNLYDVLQLKAYQLEMDENLHTTIHESINHFFNVIKNSPESLSPDLSILKGKKYFYLETALVDVQQ